jgi:hypothetical protein
MYGCAQGHLNQAKRMKLSLLRYLFLVDAAVLSLLGALLIFAPKQLQIAFGFRDLPEAVSYLIGLWGCVLGTLAIGYVIAAANPVRHRVWALVGIARGALECGVGLVYLARQTVSFQQAGFGIIVAAVMTVAYIALYPRKPQLAAPGAPAEMVASSR